MNTSINNNVWGTETLNFGRFHELGAAASQFRSGSLPTQEVLASTLEAFQATLPVTESTDPGSGSKRRKTPTNEDEDRTESVADDVGPLDSLQVVDGAIAVFIQSIRIVYVEVSTTVLQYLQFIVYVYLEGYASPSHKPVSRSWLMAAAETLFRDSSMCMDKFSRLAQPGHLIRLYYGLNNLLVSLEKDDTTARTPPDAEKFRTQMVNVKAAINNEVIMREYLLGLEELAKLYTLEAFSFRKKLEKIAAINKLIPISVKGRQLRRRLYELFPLPVPQRRAEYHSQLLHFGKTARSDGSVALPARVSNESRIGEGDLPAVHVPNGRDVNNFLLRLRVLLRAAENSRLIPDGQQFACDVIELSNSALSELSFEEKVRRLDRVVCAIPEQHSQLRAVVYNMFPIPVSVADISAAVDAAWADQPPAVNGSSASSASFATFEAPEVLQTPVAVPMFVSDGRRQPTATEDDFFRELEALQEPQAESVGTAVEVPCVGSIQAQRDFPSVSTGAPVGASVDGTLAAGYIPASSAVSMSASLPSEVNSSAAVDPALTTEASVSGSSSSAAADPSAPSSVPAAAQEAEGEQPRKKKSRTSVDGLVASSSSETIDVSFKDVAGHVLRFKVKTRILVSKAMRAYCSHSGGNQAALRFSLGSRVLSGDEHIAALGLQDSDVILVLPVE